MAVITCALKMKAAHSSKMLISFYRTTRCHIKSNTLPFSFHHWLLYD